LTGTQTLVNLDEGFGLGLGVVPFQRVLDRVGFHERLENQCVAAQADRSKQNGYWNLAGPIDSYVNNVVAIALEFQPCAAIGNHRRTKEGLAARVVLPTIIDAG